MSLPVAEKIVDFIFKRSILNDEEVDIGFFGGEPLLRLPLIERIINLVKANPLYPVKQVNFSIVTNGTVFNKRVIDLVEKHRISFGISCDGPPSIQDMFRRTRSGRRTSDLLERNIRRAKEAFTNVMVNAVYHPDTYRQLPDTVRYFASLGVGQIYLNPDFSASWKRADVESIQEVYDRVGEIYIQHYLEGRPLFVSLIDSKIGILLRGGYHEMERCRMGKAEFAFTPDGDIYPCERLVGNGKNDHCIGNVETGMNTTMNQCHLFPEEEANSPCTECGIQEYCMNWCGCSNYMATGLYNRVSPFLCASEQAAMKTASDALVRIESELGPTFSTHAAGHILANSLFYTSNP